MSIIINGYGRIGRQIMRIAFEKKVKIIAINDPSLTSENARLLTQYDSVYGKFEYDVSVDRRHLTIGKKKILISNEKDIFDIEDLKSASIIVDSSGIKRDASYYKKLLGDNSKLQNIIVTNDYDGADERIVFGVDRIEKSKLKKKIITTSSCDCVAMAPLLESLKSKKIKSTWIASLHPYTSHQSLLDNNPISSGIAHSPLLIRSAINTLIPKKTSIADNLMKTLPYLKGKISSYQIRVPTSCVSGAMIEIDFEENLDDAFVKKWLEGLRSPIFKINDDLLSSIEFCGDQHSIIIDKRLMINKGKNLKLLIWYDNEAGYSSRVVDLLKLLGKS